MTTGAVVALAMDLCERGAADYGLAFGDATGYLAAPEMIARREGWGAELALGARDLAALKGRPELAPHIKGLELPAYDPRAPSAWASATRPPIAGPATCAPSPPPTNPRGGGAGGLAGGQAGAPVEQQDFSALAWTGVWCANMYMDTDFLASTSVISGAARRRTTSS